MRTYIKKFENESEYAIFVNSSGFVTPNVSAWKTNPSKEEVKFNKTKPYVELPYLTFVAEEANSTIKLNRTGTATTLANASLQYSTDNGETWNDYTLGDAITLANVGDSVKFKGTNTRLGVNSSNYHKFVITGKIKASGDITSLFNGVGGDFAMPAYGCNGLFVNCSSLTVAPELPSTTLATYCYNSLFQGCTSLASAPELPATTLATYCYQYMFQGCTSLTSAPELPATTLATNCYYYMFKNCTSLTSAPELPATTLATYCYCYMFQGCTSLTSAPELPATTLASYCYHYMFQGCSNLSYIKAMFTTTPSGTYTGSWVKGVASNGTFVKNAAASWTTTGVSGIPNGWTVETATA